MYRPKYQLGNDHNILDMRHSHLHDRMKRDVTTINGEVVSVVFVTAEPSFGGVLGSPSTTGGDGPTSTAQANAAASSSIQYPYESISQRVSSTSESDFPTSTSDVFSQMVSSSPTPSSQHNFSSLTATASPSSSFSDQSGGSQSAKNCDGADDCSADSDSSTANTTGMSAGGMAGMAIGIMLAVGAVLALILFLLHKKKKQIKAEQAREDAEKNAAAAAAAAAKKSEAPAPTLTLRPASSFLPELLGGAKNRLSQGNMLGGSKRKSQPLNEKYFESSGHGQQHIQMTEKPAPAENPFRDPENPFADPVRSVHQPPAHIDMPEPTPAPAPIPMPMPAPQLDHSSEKIAMDDYEEPVHRAISPRQEHPMSPEPIEMPSPPLGVQVSQQAVPNPAPVTPIAPVAPMSSAPPADEGNVYRVLIEFTPSMDDELDIRPGQVVRLLHEYDDGWCLAARLDRSQQGAVPRTCLAAKPSKPRPGPGRGPMGPPGPNGRPMSPSMRNGPPQGRPMSPGGRNMGPPPNGMRPLSPGAYNQSPRPLSPGPRSTTQKRSQSPGPYGPSNGPAPMAREQRKRSNSSSQTAREVRERRETPPGPSPLNTAAVPGMAM